MAERVIDTLITVFGFRTDKSQLEQTKRNLANLRKGLDDVSRNVAIAGGAASAALFGIGRTLLNFERAQNLVASKIQDATAEQLQMIREQAVQLGSSTSKSATEAANAQAELAQAGLSVNEILAATPHVLNLAIAGHVEMSQAASLVTSSLKSFGLEATETQRVVDIFATVSANANTTVAKMEMSLSHVAPLAAQAGISLEEVASAFGTLQNAGLRAETASTALRNMLLIMIDQAPDDAFVEGLASIGLGVGDLTAQLGAGGLGAAFDTLAQGLGGLSDLERVGVIEQLFGAEAASAAASIAGMTDTYHKLYRQAVNANGAAERTRDRMDSGLPGAVAQFRSALEGLNLALGAEGGLTSRLMWALNTGTQFVRWLSNANWFVKGFASLLLIAVGILVPLAVAIKTVSFLLGAYSFVGTIAAKVTAFHNAQLAGLGLGAKLAAIGQAILAKAMILTSIKTGIATVAAWGFNAALLANPITLIILGIAALIGILILLVKNWDTVKKVVVGVWDTVVSAMRTAWNWVKDNWPLLLAILGGPFTAVAYLVWKFRDNIINALRAVWSWIAGMVDRLLGWVDNIAERVQRVIGAVAFWRGDAEETETPDTTQPGDLVPPEFERGGIVPGRRGQSILARLHAGELVLPAQTVDMLRQLGNVGLPAIPPVVPAYAGAAAGAGATRMVEANITLDSINISVERGDPDEIAAQVGVSLQRQLQDTAEDFASRIVR